MADFKALTQCLLQLEQVLKDGCDEFNPKIQDALFAMTAALAPSVQAIVEALISGTADQVATPDQRRAYLLLSLSTLEIGLNADAASTPHHEGRAMKVRLQMALSELRLTCAAVRPFFEATPSAPTVYCLLALTQQFDALGRRLSNGKAGWAPDMSEVDSCLMHLANMNAPESEVFLHTTGSQEISLATASEPSEKEASQPVEGQKHAPESEPEGLQRRTSYLRRGHRREHR